MTRLHSLLPGLPLVLIGCIGCTSDAAAPAADITYALPQPDRPVVDLRFDLTTGLDSVEGDMTVEFTADRRVCELVFRLWANKPQLVSAGNELEVTATSVAGRAVRPRYSPAGAPVSTQGSLLRLPLRHCLPPGGHITAEVGFVLHLAEHTAERIGWSDDLAWFGTGFPILAWQRGHGWATNPVVNQVGEMTSSDEFRLRSLEVVVPESYEVLGTGEPLGREDGPLVGTAVERFRAESVRDVAVTVGELETYERELPGGVTVHLGRPSSTGAVMALDSWADEVERAVVDTAAQLGPYPYPDLWVSLLPDCPTGIEFPGAIQFRDLPVGAEAFSLLVSHEVAHMWFYGLVGNNQGTSPWLDEALATYTQQLVDDAIPVVAPLTPGRVQGHVGQSMAWYARPVVRRFYGAGVYGQGAAMLAEARTAVGSETFDRLLREYVAEQAHRIATPTDFATAFADAPEALEILREYGAIGE
ncbi:MAG: hypothetical protein M3Q17_00595 [Actinomycetota bacterium]|nr:hypothetical protein [Actinomycetota bacterium]